ncbi:hypothetical protein X801_10376, partial [Opisthorchis viverrini]
MTFPRVVCSSRYLTIDESSVDLHPCYRPRTEKRSGIEREERAALLMQAGSTGARATGVDISPCESEPCALSRGVNYVARVTFIANENVGTTGFTVHGTVGSRPMAIPLPSNGVCVFLFPPCPVEAGGRYIYTYTGAVPPNFPL